MATKLTYAWLILAGLALMFTAQYAISIREYNAGAKMESKSKDALKGVIINLKLYFWHTVNYVSNMAKTTLMAFGLFAGGILWTLVGLLQFDPFTWFYSSVTVFSGLQAFGIVERNPLTVFALLGAFAIGLYYFRQLSRSIFADD